MDAERAIWKPHAVLHSVLKSRTVCHQSCRCHEPCLHQGEDLVVNGFACPQIISIDDKQHYFPRSSNRPFSIGLLISVVENGVRRHRSSDRLDVYLKNLTENEPRFDQVTAPQAGRLGEQAIKPFETNVSYPSWTGWDKYSYG